MKSKRITISVIVMVLCFLSFSVSQSLAFWGKSKQKAEESTEVEVKEETTKADVVKQEKKAVKKAVKSKPQKVSKEIKQRRALVQRKRKQMENIEWTISVNLLSGKGKKQTDTLTFSNNQVVSANLTQEGFPATNYSLTVQDNGVLIWETMQTSANGSITFWRGEVDASIQEMRGVLSRHVDDATSQDYSFISTSKKAVKKSSGEGSR